MLVAGRLTNICGQDQLAAIRINNSLGIIGSPILMVEGFTDQTAVWIRQITFCPCLSNSP